MASNSPLTKDLKDLNKTEAVALLEEMEFQKITETLQSGQYGKVTGRLLLDLDDDAKLQSIGIENSFQREQFLKSIEVYKANGVSLDLLETATTDKTQLCTVSASKKISQESIDSIQTPQRDDIKLQSLLSKSQKITETYIKEMEIYAYPAKKVQVKDLQKPLYGTNLKKIIIMGETGTGKSTLINAFINYAVGVKMEDPFRFKLVVDEDDRANDQTISQTSEISGYLINDTLLDFSIQIWDTPGFGDTRGIERDEVIKEQINELLKLEDFCHAVCFVVKANVNRLTDTQKYIIDRVLLFFGKEAQENIYLLATFADDDRPDVFQALEKCNNFPFEENRCFAFNNGSLFKPFPRRTSFSEQYWDIANANIAKLFSMIGENDPFSLTSTKEVITQREDLNRNLNAITQKLGNAAFRKDVWEKNLQDLQIQQDTLIASGKITCNVPQITVSKVRTCSKNTICQECSTNCHIGCSKIGVVFCDKFNWKYKCKICGCDHSCHKKVRYKYEFVNEAYEVIYESGPSDMGKSWLMYEKARSDSEQGRTEEQAQLIILVEKIKSQIQRINEMAMLNFSLDVSSYFKRLIEQEEEANNFDQAKVYRKLFQEENFMINFMQHNEEAPTEITKRLLTHKEKLDPTF